MLIMDPLSQTVNEIREALLEAEEEHPDSQALPRLHKLLEAGWLEYGPKLGVSKREAVVMAGGGTPKTGGRG